MIKRGVRKTRFFCSVKHGFWKKSEQKNKTLLATANYLSKFLKTSRHLLFYFFLHSRFLF